MQYTYLFETQYSYHAVRPFSVTFSYHAVDRNKTESLL